MNWKRTNFFTLVLLFLGYRVLASPLAITLQSRIAKPDGQVLEATSVNFRVSITDTVGSCVIFQEDFPNRNLSNSKGLVSLTIGTGTKSFPLGPMSITEVFNNFGSPAFSCQSGGTINAGLNDRRKMILQFNDGNGWQTVPAMDINSSPYALNSLSAYKLGDFPAQDYIRTASLPTCVGGEALHFNGTSITCISSGGGGSVTSVTSANSDLNIASSTSTPIITLNSGTGANQILKLNASSEIPAVSGVNLTNLNATQLTGGTIPLARLPTGTPDQVLVYNGSGVLASEAQLAVSRGGTGSSSFVGSRIIASTISGNALTNFTCGLNQIIKFDGSGAPTCSTDNTGGTGDINQNGNSFTSAMIIGTNDSNSVAIETNGVTKMTVTSDGNVGIGSPSPAARLEIVGADSTTASAPLALSVTGGTSSFGGGNGGGISMTAGNSAGGANGGNIILSSGWTANVLAADRAATLSLFGSQWAGEAGTATLKGGVGYNARPGGEAILQGGTALGGSVNGGASVVAGGAFYNSSGGNVTLNGGAFTGAGDDGNVVLANLRGNVAIGSTSASAKLDVAGEVKIGNTALACSMTTRGAIRYNTGTNVLEFCNGTGWNLVQAAACTDPTPDAIVLTPEANAVTSALTTSNIVQVSGMNCAVPVTISGSGSPQYRICSDVGCGAEIQGWTSSPSSISNGDYLQVRLTADSVGGSPFQATLIAGSGATVWTVTTAGGDCVGTTPPVGTVCADGTIYAGLSPDGSVKMFTTRCDYGQSWDGFNCTGTRSGYAWNNGGSGAALISNGYNSSVTGRANTTAIAGLTNDGSPYAAAIGCESLSENARSDWYLPASSELSVLYAGRNAIRNFDVSGPNYWSSTEDNSQFSYVVRFSDGVVDSGYHGRGYKTYTHIFRCVRR